MTRLGGRCPAHGVLLEFDPWSPHAHRCPRLRRRLSRARSTTAGGSELPALARRARRARRHAATPLGGDAALRAISPTAILAGYAERYRDYPNRDNVLGPTRPFFSTYLESIWLLQLTVALDLLESRDGRTALGDSGARDDSSRRASPSSPRTTRGGPTGRSGTTQRSPPPACCSATPALVERAVRGPSGLAHAPAGRAARDGTWYEGENYHLFAHRGLWYGVTIAEAQGLALPAEGAAALPRGLRHARSPPRSPTSPSRRDATRSTRSRSGSGASPRAASSGSPPATTRDWSPRWPRSTRRMPPSGDTGRARSTAEAERNVPPVRLSRASLGWKSLLFARAELPPLEARRPASVHLAGQGLAVLRRNDAQTYVALDYGESGGGHGHPDRLNLWLVVGDARILDDVGTGSYVDPTLHWYRSTLAHNAPLADGRSQWRVDGVLTEYDERGTKRRGSSARAPPSRPASPSSVRSSVMGDYLVDEVRWEAQRVITFDLPYHIDARLLERRAMGAGDARGRTRAGGRLRLHRQQRARPRRARALVPGRRARRRGSRLGRLRRRRTSGGAALAPGPPGEARRRFLLLRARARSRMHSQRVELGRAGRRSARSSRRAPRCSAAFGSATSTCVSMAPGTSRASGARRRAMSCSAAAPPDRGRILEASPPVQRGRR